MLIIFRILYQSDWMIRAYELNAIEVLQCECDVDFDGWVNEWTQRIQRNDKKRQRDHKNVNNQRNSYKKNSKNKKKTKHNNT